MYNLNEQQIGAINYIIAYLKFSPCKEILFSKHEHLDIMEYTDFDFIGSKLDNKKSTFGYMSFMSDYLMTWKIRNKIWSPCPVQKLNIMHFIVLL